MHVHALCFLRILKRTMRVHDFQTVGVHAFWILGHPLLIPSKPDNACPRFTQLDRMEQDGLLEGRTEAGSFL
jgi:hypothetical protein